MATDPLTHFDADCRAVMVDVSGKVDTSRVAVASGTISMSAATLALVKNRAAAKGDVIGVAEIAGIMGAKKTSDLIPLCHPLPLSNVQVSINIDDEKQCINVTSTTKTLGKTGVEMEALTAVSVTLLTLYDMLKASDKSMVISDIKLNTKTGGKSGDWARDDASS
ncbi:cyclic pyranopterin monophosphate synthase MoaC [Robiginitomaculum antarcticum]|uniref:cyclic pyranopterin monophosphate synthase MoaC n=1 Tax=Robiginitomaculum antarcticum TaxID=437507 RepID=UPI0003715B04|nr:cyclic pyranopterin monophosphate synthase MoaC [Robiginitomaculum antarcticum]